MAKEKTLEYRVCWAASTNATFQDEGEWHPANPDETAEEIEDSLGKGGHISNGLEIAINESGFEWWVETREAQSDAKAGKFIEGMSKGVESALDLLRSRVEQEAEADCTCPPDRKSAQCPIHGHKKRGGADSSGPAPDCKTCGGSREGPEEFVQEGPDDGRWMPTDCPDCQPTQEGEGVG